MERVLEGELSHFNVPDLLTFLHMGTRTGVLTLERATQETKLFFREGNPIFATSSKPELRLGDMLVRLGKVTQEGLDVALAEVQVGRHRIGQVLLARGLLSETELGLFLKVQVSEVIFESFVWQEGLFTFWDQIQAPPTAVTLDIDLQNLLMEGMRRIDERGRLSEVFPDQALCVETVANPEWVKHSVTMTPEEWKVFFLADGRRSIGEICRLAGNPDDLATLQVLHNLVMAKLLVVASPTEAPPAPESIPAPEEVGELFTQRVVDGRPAVAAAPVSVEFATGVRGPRVEDDTKEVVTPKAVQYMPTGRRLTVSRLVLLKDNVETSFPLLRDTYTLGRHKNNDIVITDPKVSSFHARLDRSAEGFTLVDLKSRNGSFLNGKRIESAHLDTGDEVRLGTAKLQYRVDYTAQ